MKFSSLRSNRLMPDAYYNWRIFDPNESDVIKSLNHTQYIPPLNLKATKGYKNLYLVSGIGTNATYNQKRKGKSRK